MKFGSLFSGIGGIDLGLERAGMTCIWQSEIDPYACQVLAKHWPNIPNLGDIRDIDWTTVDRTDVVAGGYPCQPFSYAGVRRGGNDPRHLWPLFAECLRVVRPRYALLENVSGHLSLGFGRVLGDLAEIGYDAEWDCVPAAALGAPHLRDRVFVIATRRTSMDTDSESQSGQPEHGSTRTWPTPMGNPERERREERRRSNSAQVQADNACGTSPPSPSTRRPDRPSGLFWSSEPEVGRVADGIPRRLDRLRGLGNAVVPQVAEHIGNIIMEADNDR
jgi:DNA (cytosine-5)-methyltransferase 1